MSRSRKAKSNVLDEDPANEQLPAGQPRAVLSWYDFLCSFCYVGQHRTAILRDVGIRVVELPFPIHPDLPSGGVAVGVRTGPMYRMLEREAREAGLPLNWPSRLPATRLALRVAEWTRRHRPFAFSQLHRELFAAHFALGEDVEDQVVVDHHAKASGVDLAALHAALADGSAETSVAATVKLGRKHGVKGTPAWLLGGRLISGLLSPAWFERRARFTV